MRLTLESLKEIYSLSFNELINRAQEVHKKHAYSEKMHLCSAKSIKTGRCPEDCAYCPQSIHYKTFVEPEAPMTEAEIVTAARRAKSLGAERFNIAAAWKRAPKGTIFEEILASIPQIRQMGLQVCCGLGSIDEEQSAALKKAGCTRYSYNLDTSEEFYSKIITTRTYQERLSTLKSIQKAGLEICCGGILGMGESIEDRLKLLLQLSQLDPIPEAVPINALVRVKGTPLGERDFIDPIEFVRFVATTRITIPTTMIVLAAGRSEMSKEMQALCFLAGANSILIDEKILTTDNPPFDEDKRLLEELGVF